MKKVILITFFGITLLFGFQKGEFVPNALAKKLNLQQHKTYIIDFFASWCVSCKIELPKLNRLNKELSSHTKIIGIDVDERSDDAKSFQKELHVSFPIINDTKQEIIKVFNPVGVPAIYVIRDRKVIDKIIGAHDDIEKVLEKYK